MTQDELRQRDQMVEKQHADAELEAVAVELETVEGEQPARQTPHGMQPALRTITFVGRLPSGAKVSSTAHADDKDSVRECRNAVAGHVLAVRKRTKVAP